MEVCDGTRWGVRRGLCLAAARLAAMFDGESERVLPRLEGMAKVFARCGEGEGVRSAILPPVVCLDSDCLGGADCGSDVGPGPV